jgi:type II secretory pathway component PulM
MSDDNLFDDSLFDDFEDEEVPPFESDYEDDLLDMEDTSEKKPGGNRTFIVIIGIIFAFFVLIGGAIAAYVLLIAPQSQSKAAQEAALINAQNTATSVAATEQSMVMQLALTPSATLPPTATLEEAIPNTPTAVMIVATDTPVPTATEEITVEVGAADFDALTATVASLLTLAAEGKTATATPSALPDSGFASDVGLPGLLGLAALMVGIIFLARRLRTAANTAR